MLSNVTERAGLADGGDGVLIYSVSGAASLAVAQVASSADFAGVASPADFGTVSAVVPR